MSFGFTYLKCTLFITIYKTRTLRFWWAFQLLHSVMVEHSAHFCSCTFQCIPEPRNWFILSYCLNLTSGGLKFVNCWKIRLFITREGSVYFILYIIVAVQQLNKTQYSNSYQSASHNSIGSWRVIPEPWKTSLRSYQKDWIRYRVTKAEAFNLERAIGGEKEPASWLANSSHFTPS